MNKALLFLFLSLCCTTLLLAQTKTGSIEGLVTDNDNEPLVGMNVALQGTSLGNITDTEGEFSITRVPAGQYELVVSGVGYQTQRRTVEVSANETLRLEFFLQPSLTQLQDIEIIGRKETSYQNDVSFVATKTATPLQDVPQSISYVTKEIIQDQQAFRTGDIVKNISGVNQFSFLR